jgi:hypothetical protein
MMFNAFRSGAVSAQVLKLVMLLFAATAVGFGYPSPASAHLQPPDSLITDGE